MWGAGEPAHRPRFATGVASGGEPGARAAALALDRAGCTGEIACVVQLIEIAEDGKLRDVYGAARAVRERVPESATSLYLGGIDPALALGVRVRVIVAERGG